MTKEDKQKLKSTIKSEILSLENEIVALEKLLHPIKKECSLDNVAHQTLKQEQNINIQRYEVAIKRLNRLKNTFLKVDSKEYGICKECEDEIPLKRLELMPESIYCVDCMNELGL